MGSGGTRRKVATVKKSPKRETKKPRTTTITDEGPPKTKKKSQKGQQPCSPGSTSTTHAKSRYEKTEIEVSEVSMEDHDGPKLIDTKGVNKSKILPVRTPSSKSLNTPYISNTSVRQAIPAIAPQPPPPPSETDVDVVQSRKKSIGRKKETEDKYEKEDAKKKAKKKKELDASAFFAHIESKGWAGIEEEFHVGHRPATSLDMNPITRHVITNEAVNEGSPFYDASIVELPGIDNKFYAVSMPTSDMSSIENFWKLVYDTNVTNIFVLETFTKTKKAPFFPMEANKTADYGKMFISNKKMSYGESTTEKGARDYQAVLEVLPDGCSNSIIVRLIHSIKWPEKFITKPRLFALHITRMLKNDKTPSMIVCKTGKGPTGMFILLFTALTKLIANQPFDMPTILKQLRTARWGAIQTTEQYILTYMLVLDYLNCKCNKRFGEKTGAYIAQCMEYIKSKGYIKDAEVKDNVDLSAAKKRKGVIGFLPPSTPTPASDRKPHKTKQTREC